MSAAQFDGTILILYSYIVELLEIDTKNKKTGLFLFRANEYLHLKTNGFCKNKLFA